MTDKVSLSATMRRPSSYPIRMGTPGTSSSISTGPVALVFTAAIGDPTVTGSSCSMPGSTVNSSTERRR
jgi:hypothetical protein